MNSSRASLAVLTVAAAALAVLLILDPPRPRSSPDDGWELPRQVREISGLAVTERKTLLTMDDEVGVVYEFNPASGEIWKIADLGIRGDFEGIDYIDGEILLVTSGGMLYRIYPDGRYERSDTGAGEACEIEGLHHRRTAAGVSLLLVCKTNYEAAHEDSLQLFRYELATGELAIEVRRPFAELGIDKTLNPAGMTIANGEYLVVAGKQERLLRLREDFSLISMRKLKGHRQPEGIAVIDGRVYIANEGKKGEGGKISGID